MICSLSFCIMRCSISFVTYLFSFFFLLIYAVFFFFFFFFQAEDGIRDGTVTGVQTCALPISYGWARERPRDRRSGPASRSVGRSESCARPGQLAPDRSRTRETPGPRAQIGRASCRERV